MNDVFDVNRYHDLIEKEIDAFTRVLAHADLAQPAPTCPGWAVRDVVIRAGEMFQWVEGLVHHGQSTRPDFRDVRLHFPEEGESYAAWLADAGRSLMDELRVHDPAKPIWTWGAEQTLRFWARRALHDTGIHRADVEIAVGWKPQFEPDVAADGIEEFLEILSYAGNYSPRIAGIRGRGERIRLQAPDASWTITLGPQGYTWARDVPGDAEVTAAGTVEDLLLLIWGRNKPDSPKLEVTGAREVLAYWSGKATMN